MTQHDLFRPWGRPEGGQPTLFDDRGPTDSSLSCGECGEPLTPTPSGYLACPRGHGRLLHDTTEEGSGLAFADDPAAPGGSDYVDPDWPPDDLYPEYGEPVG